ncbi:1-phosphatidylinositol 4 [Escovopsis weberi]|uniref:Phosphoinositide phospholipase C n=1 Tax=Escovopsis weberi TaxID=150374 RepID=A0A0M8MX55_ESCWE|nr:1-phosphatidylinositol 4 [Escovopsis weberi]
MAEIVINQVSSSLNSLNLWRSTEEDQDDRGEDIPQDDFARPSPSTANLRVSHALRTFLVEHGVLSEYEAGLTPGPHAGFALRDLLEKDHIRVPPAVVDQSHALPEYFVSSSHNTYLLAHQLYGESSAAAYETAIRTGSRCVEIDAWDNAEDEDEPKVTHGYTLVTRVPFRSVCERIRRVLDSEDPHARGTPIMISLENHCGERGQMRLVHIMREVFGPRLLTAPVGSGNPDEYPPLELLAGKILVIAEFHLPNEADDEDNDAGGSSGGGGGSYSLDGIERRARRSYRKYVNGAAGKEDGGKPAQKAATNAIIIPELAALGVYAQSVKPRDKSWYDPGVLADGPHHHLINVSESGLSAHLPAHRAAIARHNARDLMRVFPRGTRITSSNLPAVPFWGVGAQICALNWQTYNTSHQLNRALFAGSEGYVLKPAALRRGGRGVLGTGRWRRLTLHVAGATAVPIAEGRDVDDTIRPYVTCSLYSPLLLNRDEGGGGGGGGGADRRPEGEQVEVGEEASPGGLGLGEEKVRQGDAGVNKGIKRKTGWYRQHRWLGFLRRGANPPPTDPLWNERLVWEYEDNELVFLRILIKSDDSWAPNPRLAVAAVRVMYVVPEWRFVRMTDLAGRETGCTLLVRFEVEDLE